MVGTSVVPVPPGAEIKEIGRNKGAWACHNRMMVSSSSGGDKRVIGATLSLGIQGASGSDGLHCCYQMTADVMDSLFYELNDPHVKRHFFSSRMGSSLSHRLTIPRVIFSPVFKDG